MIQFKLLTSNLLLFHYDYKPKCPLAPGMNAKITITFKCTSMEDKYELITLMTTENKKTYILVGAENMSPILHCEYNIPKTTHFLRQYLVIFSLSSVLCHRSTFILILQYNLWISTLLCPRKNKSPLSQCAHTHIKTRKNNVFT